ncbi:hypothetical protein QYQ99_28130 (plasmid) [Comamonas testosteroni]|jgi:hypothetical protein|nr:MULTISPECIES: hypothetical protein [Burkholderiales]WKL18872.1 hypothetical protein QYQ99_28130 [Comamonas testosteroni]
MLPITEPLSEPQKVQWQVLCRRMMLGNFLLAIGAFVSVAIYVRLVPGTNEPLIHALSDTLLNAAPAGLAGLLYAIGLLIFTRRIAGGFHRFYVDALYFRAIGSAIAGAIAAIGFYLLAR